MLADILSRNRNAISLAFCISFSALSIIWQSNPFAQGMAFFGKMADRISSVFSSGLGVSEDFFVEVDEYRDLKRKYDQMQKQVESYRLEQDKFKQLKSENERYRKIMGFSETPDYQELKAEVLGVRLDSITPRMIVGRGRKHGVTPFMPVIARANDLEGNLVRCIVGVIVSVDESAAIVQPINHPEFRMGVRIDQTGEWAILNGNSDRFGQAVLTYLTTDFAPEKATFSDRDAAIKPGFSVYTSGAGGIFPPGIPVGYVLEMGPRQNEFKSAYIKPFAPISSLDFVSIILKRPAAWSSNWDRNKRWEEHLETEFGPPEYPEVSNAEKSRLQRQKELEAKRREQALKAAAQNQNTTNANNPNNPGNASRDPAGNANNLTTEERRRRVQNPAFQGEGGR